MADSTTLALKPSSRVKLVLLGEAAVGKSSLALRFVKNDFQENQEPTIRAAFLIQKINLPNQTIEFEIWDTTRQERFALMYYRNAQSALVIYDLTKPSSLIKAKYWVTELQRQASPGIVIALVGNKLDLTNELGESNAAANVVDTDNVERRETKRDVQKVSTAEREEIERDARKVSTAEAKSYAEKEGLLFFETSAKLGTNVTEVFTAIANAISETSLKETKGSGTIQSNTGRTENQSRINLTRPRDNASKKGCSCAC